MANSCCWVDLNGTDKEVALAHVFLAIWTDADVMDNTVCTVTDGCPTPAAVYKVFVVLLWGDGWYWF